MPAPDPKYTRRVQRLLRKVEGHLYGYFSTVGLFKRNKRGGCELVLIVIDGDGCQWLLKCFRTRTEQEKEGVKWARLHPTNPPQWVPSDGTWHFLALPWKTIVGVEEDIDKIYKANQDCWRRCGLFQFDILNNNCVYEEGNPEPIMIDAGEGLVQCLDCPTKDEMLKHCDDNDKWSFLGVALDSGEVRKTFSTFVQFPPLRQKKIRSPPPSPPKRRCTEALKQRLSFDSVFDSDSDCDAESSLSPPQVQRKLWS